VKKIIIISIGVIIAIIGGLLAINPVEKSMEEKWLEQKITSGPFTLDKNEYFVGEKIFITVRDLKQNDKGEMIFFRPLNGTSWTNYTTMSFDGSAKDKVNLYFEPQLSEMKKICSVNDLAGNWKVKLIGTEYPEMNFKIINQTAEWDNRTFEPIC
jgi:hypothetical protein